MSREHAVISKRGSRWMLRDLDSKNGCYRNGQRVLEGELLEQDVWRIGEWVAVVVYLPDKPDAELRAIEEVRPGVLAGPALAAVYKRVQTLACAGLDLFVSGETGSGKELLVKALHDLSQRRGPLIAVNCATVPESLAEAHLFGHARGAFTGAQQARPGYFRAAHGGTLFLDELNELPPSVQPKLLRVLEDRKVTELGGSGATSVDVRVVSAAQLQPGEITGSSKLRPDLLARLRGIEVALPPLRARREEVLPLFRQFASKNSQGNQEPTQPSLSKELAEWLCLYDWPMNVRELKQLSQALAVELAQTACWDLQHLPARLRSAEQGAAEDTTPRAQSRTAHAPERGGRSIVTPTTDQAALLKALRDAKGNVSQAAASLGISRQQAYRQMDKLPAIELSELRSRGAFGKARK